MLVRVPITNTLLIDAIAAGTTFVPNSILVDGIPRPNENPITGITLDIILPNNTIIVTFQVNVVSAPSQNNINNIAVIHYEYQPDPSLPPISETTSSILQIYNLLMPFLSLQNPLIQY